MSGADAVVDDETKDADTALDPTQGVVDGDQAQDEAAFLSGYTEGGGRPISDAGDDRKPETVAELQQEQADAPPAPEQDEPDPDPLSKFEQRLRNVEGRNGALIAQNQTLERQIADLRRGGAAPVQQEARPSEADIIAASLSGGESLDRLKEDFPEFAQVIEDQGKRIAAVIDERLAKGGKVVRLEDLPQGEVDKLVGTVRERLIDDEIESAHAGWKEKVRTPQFAAWLDAQPEKVKAMADVDRAREAIQILNMYDASLTPAKTGGQNTARDRLRGNVPATSGASRTIAAQPSDDEAFEAGYRSQRGGR